MQEQEKLQSPSENLPAVLPGGDLSPQLRRFVYEYLIDYNHRRAASEVGLNPKQALSLLRTPTVREFLVYLNDQLCDSSLITKHMVEVEILDVALPVARGDVAVPRIVNGIPMNCAAYDSNAHIRLIGDMSKHSGFTDNETEKGGVIVNINLNALGIREGVTIDGQKVQNQANVRDQGQKRHEADSRHQGQGSQET